MKIYLAAGLFNAGERLHNIFLEMALRELGYEVILPQREALKFFDPATGTFDVAGIVENCKQSSADGKNIVVANSDGADGDSGTCVELGIAVASTGRAVVFRTDFRTAMDRELGVNAMLKPKGVVFIYHPCFFTELSQVEPYYRELARKIDEAVRNISV